MSTSWGGEQDKSLLNIRVFDRATINRVYTRQTQDAKAKGVSNCPDCALQQGNNSTRIYKLAEMDADHVTAWSHGATPARPTAACCAATTTAPRATSNAREQNR